MKTLVFFGSGRQEGHTRDMVDLFIQNLDGEVEIIDAYKEDVQPCIDCRYCWKVKGCSIKDNMQDIYKKIDEADNIIFASPIYFYTITSPLKAIIDRLQIYWAAIRRKEISHQSYKKGGILLVGGSPNFKNQFIAGEIVVKSAFKELGVKSLGTITLANSDKDSLDQKPEIKKKIIKLAKTISSNKIGEREK